MAALPLLKMGILVFKQAAKPVAKSLQARAKTSPFFRRMCIGVGNGMNQMTARMTAFGSNVKLKKVKGISEETAISNGAALLGESFIILTGSALIAFEYRRKDIESDKKKAKARAEKRDADNALDARLFRMEEDIAELRLLVEAQTERQEWQNRQWREREKREDSAAGGGSGGAGAASPSTGVAQSWGAWLGLWGGSRPER